MSGPWTIFHLDSERSLRGGERQLLYLACYLRSRGHRNVVVCRKDLPLHQEARRQDLEALCLPFACEWDPSSAWFLRQAARAASSGPVILHTHTAHGAALAYLASRWGGPPWVAHRRVDFAIHGSFSGRLKYGAARRVLAVSGAVRDIVRKSLPSAHIVVVPDCLPLSEEEARLVGWAQGPLRPPSEREREDARKFLGSRWDLPVDAPWVGNLAAWVAHKDQATLLRSAPEVLRRHANAHFILAGSGPLESELKALSGALGIESRVRFVGFQDNPRIWLSALDVFALSSWGEGMGSVLLEVMACALPIVATTAGGIPEVIENGRTGLLVSPRDPEVFARALAQALAQPVESRRRAQAALETLEKFSLSKMGTSIEEVYANVAVHDA